MQTWCIPACFSSKISDSQPSEETDHRICLTFCESVCLCMQLTTKISACLQGVKQKFIFDITSLVSKDYNIYVSIPLGCNNTPQLDASSGMLLKEMTIDL